MEPVSILAWGTVLGLGASLVMDGVGILRQGLAGMNGFYGLVGRWIGWLAKGRVRHDNIRRTDPVTGEVAIGWAAHIAMGVVFGVIYVALLGGGVIRAPQLLQGLGFGLVSVLVPWLIFQPLFGWGIAASKTPNPWMARKGSLITHGVFGLGLWLTGWVLSALSV